MNVTSASLEGFISRMDVLVLIEVWEDCSSKIVWPNMLLCGDSSYCSHPSQVRQIRLIQKNFESANSGSRSL